MAPSGSETERVISCVVFSMKDVGIPIRVLLSNDNHEGKYCDEIVRDSLSTSSTNRVKLYSLSSIASDNTVVENTGESLIGLIIISTIDSFELFSPSYTIKVSPP